MSWAGTIVGACNERRRIVVIRESTSRYEYFRCANDEAVRLDWMIGMTIQAACIDSTLYVDEIDVGTRTGHNEFRLRLTPDAVGVTSTGNGDHGSTTTSD